MTRGEAIEYIEDTPGIAGFFVVAITEEDIKDRLPTWSSDEFSARNVNQKVITLSDTADVMQEWYENEQFHKDIISAFLEAEGGLEDD